MSSRKNPYAAPDVHTRAAKAQGYPARSVFKLKEIDQRARLLAPGRRVVDLGAAPGSWSLWAAERVGARGHVLAIDLKEMKQAFSPWVRVVQGDALEIGSELFGEHAPFDVVLSDMAPNTSGNKTRDQALSLELFLRALEVGKAHGAPGSSFVAKLFMSGDFEQARSEVRAAYTEVKTIRADATRQNSSEVFVIGKGRR
jgi:23S rRNA (uridine2552-2'-O)-methyltransferase